MKYSLINIYEKKENFVSGNWLTNVTGALDDAITKATETKETNGGKIKIGIVEEITSTTPILNFWTNLNLIKEI